MHGVGGSNPLAPTNRIKDLQHKLYKSSALYIRRLSNIGAGLSLFSAGFLFDLRPLQVDVDVDARNVRGRFLDVDIRALAARQSRQSGPLRGPYGLSGSVMLTSSSNIPCLKY